MNDREKVLFLVSGAAISAAVAYAWQRHRQNSPKGDWKKVGTVTSLCIYPLKSGKFCAVNEANTTQIGLEEFRKDNLLPLGDRVFVIFKEKNMEFVNARTYPDMLSIKVVSISPDTVEFQCKTEKLIIQVPTDFKNLKIKMWRNEKIATVDCGDEAATWITKIMQVDQPMRIGYWSTSISERRNLSKTHANYLDYYKQMCNEFTGAYSDLSAYHIINQSSVEDLRSRIPEGSNKNVSPLNFRPNIIIEGPDPYEEDNWKWVKIGDKAVFRMFRPCTRCSLTTISPNSVRDKDSEPLKTLKTFRMCESKKQLELEGNSPRFGMYMGMINSGKIAVGDAVYVSN